MESRMNNPANDVFFDFEALPGRERYKLLISTVVPRPIAWIVSQSREGQLNAAPFSFFNAFSADPPVVGVGIGSHDPDRPKDTRRNIVDTKQFVINLVSEDMAEAMNVTAIDFERGVSEVAEAGLDTLPSVRVQPPRIAGCPVAMECELMQVVELGTSSGLVLGRVLAMHVREDVILDPVKHYIDTPAMKLIGRMHASSYARTSDLFEMNRIPRTEWRRDKDVG